MTTPARPLLNALQRTYSAQAARAKQVAPDTGPRITRLKNGILVATVENSSPVCHLGVLYNAGSRYEGRANEGVTHCIRSAANLSNSKVTGFNLTRNFQQIGSEVNCTTSREHVIYSVACTRNHLDVGLEFLTHMSMAPAFKAWELKDNKASLALDLAMLDADPCTKALEGLHRAAYREGLGTSLYMPQHKLGSHTPAVTADFIQAHYQPDNMAIVAMGVDHDPFVFHLTHTLGLGKNGGSGAGAVSAPAAAYHGGEVRIHSNSQFVHAAVASQGVGLGSADMLPVAVLQHAMGTGPRIKYSSNATTKITQAAAQATASPFAASTLNLNYTDSGLFGFHVVMQAADAGSVLQSLISHFSSLTKSGVSEEDVARGKAQLKSSMLYELENAGTALEDLGAQALLTGNVLSLESIMESIDNVTAEDVSAAAKKVINGKPSMCVVGNLSHTPYLDELA